MSRISRGTSLVSFAWAAVLYERQEFRLAADDVVCGAGVQAADGDHDRIERVEVPGHHGLQREHHLADRRDRVRGQMRLGGVTAPPVHGHGDLVGGGEHRSRPGGEHAARQPVGRDVQAVSRHRARAGRLQDAFVDHVPGAGVTFLARLEHEDHAAADLGLPGGQ
jgi:hypothetical protein